MADNLSLGNEVIRIQVPNIHSVIIFSPETLYPCNSNTIFNIQALVRGYLVRKKLKEVEKEYEMIVSTLESDLHVRWPPKHEFGLPVVSRDLVEPPKLLVDVTQRSESPPFVMNNAEGKNDEEAKGYMKDTTTAECKSALQADDEITPGNPLLPAKLEQTDDIFLNDTNPRKSEDAFHSVNSVVFPSRDSDDFQVTPTLPTPCEVSDSCEIQNRNTKHHSLSDSWMTDRSFGKMNLMHFVHESIPIATIENTVQYNVMYESKFLQII